MKTTGLPFAASLAIAASACLLAAACGGGGASVQAPESASSPGLYHLAGALGGPGNVDAAGVEARFIGPLGLAIDTAGNLFVADIGAVRKVDPSGVVTTLPPSAASPAAVAVDGNGNVYVAGDDDHAIFKITRDGQVSTLAGTVGQTGLAADNDDGTGAQARFSWPLGMTIDNAGNLYVTEGHGRIPGLPGFHSAGRIRKITPQGVVSTLAGREAVTGSADGTGAAARFLQPTGAAVDNAGNLYVADTGNSTIRKVTPAGEVTTIAGSAGNAGDADGPGFVARFRKPRGVAIDGAGNVFVADTENHTIRRIAADGSVTTVAGKAGEAGSVDGVGPAARLHSPYGIVIDPGGNLYVSDRDGTTLRKITPGGAVSTIAGSARSLGASDGPAAQARFGNPVAVAADASGSIYVTDAYNYAIRAIRGGVVTTIAGGAGRSGYADGAGDAAQFTLPSGIAAGANGDLYVADEYNRVIRKVARDGSVSTFAGVRDAGYQLIDGDRSSARFSSPSSVVADSAGFLYVTDGSTVRKVAPDGSVTTLAGDARNAEESVDGTGTAAKFAGPNAIARDAQGNLYVTEIYGKTVRKITPAGVVTTLAGTARSSRGSVDGIGRDASFSFLKGIAVDTSGNVYVSDASLIRRITPAGVVSTVAGAPGRYGIHLGNLPGSLFSPKGLWFVAPNTLLVAEESSVLRLVLPQ
ncbi:MAG TPA: hypothetical protein VEC01_18020 [Noviherbaspirillum sp.]|uniref:hypothetical protein n=1 Tax=Noviherbaspirillum sp. TaxID=1926288 RepID=UPI002D3E0B9B|nr:hypothetical protein [Noviherbaspirillum sp.]HYD97227.1 hypothetical protein [Noviherbaspirillum sp.]